MSSILSASFNDPMDVALPDRKRTAPVELSFRPKKRARLDYEKRFTCSHNLSTLAEWATLSKAHAAFFDTFLQTGLIHLLSTDDFPRLKDLTIVEAKALYKECYLKRLALTSKGFIHSASLLKYNLKPFPFLKRINSAIKIAFENQLIYIRKLIHLLGNDFIVDESLRISPIKRDHDFHKFIEEWRVYMKIESPTQEQTQQLANQMESFSDYDMPLLKKLFTESLVKVRKSFFNEMYGDLLDPLIDEGNLKSIAIKYKTLKEKSPFSVERFDDRLLPEFDDTNENDNFSHFVEFLNMHLNAQVKRLSIYLTAINLFNEAYENKTKRLDEGKHAIACDYAIKHKITY